MCVCLNQYYIVSNENPNLGKYVMSGEMSPGRIVACIMANEQLLSFATTRILTPGLYRVEIKRRQDEITETDSAVQSSSELSSDDGEDFEL